MSGGRPLKEAPHKDGDHGGPSLGLAHRRRLSIRVVLVALGGLVALVAVLGTWQVLAARNSQRNELFNGELTAAHLASSTVASAVTSRLQLLENLANQPGSSQDVTSNSVAVLEPLLGELLRLYPQFSSMSVLDASGGLLAESPDWTLTPAVDQTRADSYSEVLRSGQSYVTGVFAAPTGGPAITLGAPVRGPSGQLSGVVQATVPISELSTAVGGSSLGGGGTLVIVDQKGRALTGPASSSPASFAGLSVVSRALHGLSGTTTAGVPGFGGDRLVAYAPVRTLHWAVVVEYPLSVLDGPVTALTERLVGIGAAVLVFAIAAAAGLWLLLRQLGRQRDEIAAIFSNVGEGVATLDAAGRVLNVNPALEKLTGRHAEELEQRTWPEVFVLHDDRGEVVEWPDSPASDAITHRSVIASRGYSLTLVNSDGQRVPVAITASPMYLDSLTPSGAVVVLRDVSREREVDQLKSSLVSTVSHELRTPLTLIQGFSELLLTRSDLDSVQSQAALTQIHASSQRLGRLIDDLLSVSRIESGRLTTDVEVLDLSQVVSEVVSSFAVDHDHRFTTDIALEANQVLGDRDKTLQVLTNLISNAVKYSPVGSLIRVEARQVARHAQIDVIDEGIGMSSEEAAGIFEKFSRSNRPEVRKVGGTGLGLYITKNLVELQGGQVWIKSQQGVGSTFTFTLPLARSHGTADTSTHPEGTSRSADTAGEWADVAKTETRGLAGSQRDAAN